MAIWQHTVNEFKILFYKCYVDDILILYDQRKIDEQIILQKINGVDNNLQFKMSTEVNNTINYLDTLIHRGNNDITIELYRNQLKQAQLSISIQIIPLNIKFQLFYII